MPYLLTVILTALIIATASAIAKQNPLLAGFITALPLTSILALCATYLQTGDGEATSRYAISILVAVPASLLFFLPFLLYPKLKGSFWLYLLAGILLLNVSLFLHKTIYQKIVLSRTSEPIK